MNEGCGRFRWKLASKSPSIVTSARFWYQDLRGLILSFSVPRPYNRSQVHLTSLAVNGLPSCHLTPWRNLKVSVTPCSLPDHSAARSGTIVSSRFCGMCWSNITRLLNTAIIGPSETIVDSSWIDMLAGLSPWGIFKMPPGFCATAALEVIASAKAAHAAAQQHAI